MTTRRHVLLMTATAIAAGMSGVAARAGEEPLTIVTTTAMIADAARQIGGTHVQVTALMGPGVDPHAYRGGTGVENTLSAYRPTSPTPLPKAKRTTRSTKRERRFRIFRGR